MAEHVDLKPEDTQKEPEEYADLSRSCAEDTEINRELEEHLNLETDRIILQEQKAPKKLALHVGPRPGAVIHLPVVSPSEQLSSQKICFSSYLERMGSQRDKDGGAKIRTPKRQRKDSATDKDKEDQKKFKMDDHDKLIHIEETAIDGIELMANYKILQEDEEKPSTEDEKEREVTEDEPYLPTGDKDMSERDKDASEREKDLSEREKDSFSEMEDDEKYNNDTDNESDGKDKTGKDNKFKNLKVKFRIRPKKRGGSSYTLVMNKDAEEPKTEEPAKEDETKPDIDVELAIRQIRKGWSVHDAGDLTIGDLYLMFGSRSKLELDYWWAEPTPPLPQPHGSAAPAPPAPPATAAPAAPPDKPDRGGDSSLEDEKERARESDNEMLSPKNTYSQDSNDGMSGDERKSEQLASPEHKTPSSSGTLKLVSKLINRPQDPPPQNGFALLSDRLKRLLALVGNPHVNPAANNTIARCNCGHVCAQHRKQPVTKPAQFTTQAARLDDTSSVFRHPTPIAPRPDTGEVKKTEMQFEGLPRWRRGRPRVTDRRVVVQRLLPLLPKLSPHTDLMPMKAMPTSPPPPPRILPKPSPPSSTDGLSIVYVLSESNGQFFFHDGERRIPITQAALHQPMTIKDEQTSDDVSPSEDTPTNGNDVKQESNSCPESSQPAGSKQRGEGAADIPPDFLVSESMSLSPSRLLHDADGWLDGAVHDFSLSSFLGHLEGRPAVDSHLQSLMAESSVDYVAKFADLAAEVTDEPDPHAPSDEHT